METFVKELQAIAGELRQQAAAFAADRRQDDADLTKIRANIYDICATIGNVVCKNTPEGEREAAWLKKLEELPQNWRIALEMAQAHENGQRAAVEELKLEALEDVLARFRARKEA